MFVLSTNGKGSMRDMRTLGAMAAAIVVTSVLSAGGAVWASHQFPDVPDAGFHDQIGAIVDAGCASGFNDGTFGPRDSTTRGQFAYWTDNCGSRLVEASSDADLPITDTPIQLLDVDVEVNGATPGATQFVRVDAVMTFECEENLSLSGDRSGGIGDITLAGIGMAANECFVEFGILEQGDAGGPELIHSHLVRIVGSSPAEGAVQPTGGAGPSPATATVTASKVFEVAPGTHTFEFSAAAATSNTIAVAQARSITAHVAPFGDIEVTLPS